MAPSSSKAGIVMLKLMISALRASSLLVSGFHLQLPYHCIHHCLDVLPSHRTTRSCPCPSPSPQLDIQCRGDEPHDTARLVFKINQHDQIHRARIIFRQFSNSMNFTTLMRSPNFRCTRFNFMCALSNMMIRAHLSNQDLLLLLWRGVSAFSDLAK